MTELAGYHTRTSCASCGDSGLRTFLDFGRMPLAGCFPMDAELDGVEEYPFALAFCSSCCLVQATGVIEPDILFKDYRYLSSVGLTGHFADLASNLVDRYQLDSNSLVIEMGSNDGVFLSPLKQLGLDALGFEPSENVSRLAVEKGCRILNDYFSLENAKSHVRKGSADLFVAANCFAHIDTINDIVEGISYVLRDGAHAVIEVHDVERLVAEVQYDFAYLEHSYYYSLTALQNLFARHDMTIVDYEEIPIHSGSLRVHVKNAVVSVPSKVKARISEEESGVGTWEHFVGFADAVANHRSELMKVLRRVRSLGKRVVGYGASGRANVLANYCGIGTDLVEYVVDESSERIDRNIPGVRLPIRSREFFDQDTPPDYVLLFAWNYSEMIIKKLTGKVSNFIMPFPEPRLVNTMEKAPLAPSQ